MKLTDVQVGQWVEADGGFDCLQAGEHLVHKDKDGLYIECRAGRHYLDGQEDEDGTLIGIKMKPISISAGQ